MTMQQYNTTFIDNNHNNTNDYLCPHGSNNHHVRSRRIIDLDLLLPPASGNGHFRSPLKHRAEIEDGISSKYKDDQSRNGKTTKMANQVDKESHQFKVDGITNNTEIDDEMGISEVEPLNELTDSDVDKSNSTSGSESSTAASKAIMSCINYSFCSVSMIIVNKSLASR